MQTITQRPIRLFAIPAFVRILIAPMVEPMGRHQYHIYGDVNMPEMFVVENNLVLGIVIEMELFVVLAPVKMLCPTAVTVR